METRSRQDDSNHGKECFEIHHLHDKKIAILETELNSIKSMHTLNLDEIKLKLEKSDQKFQTTFDVLQNTISDLKIAVEKIAAVAAARSSFLHFFIPTFLAIIIPLISAIWFMSDKLNDLNTNQNQPIQQIIQKK